MWSGVLLGPTGGGVRAFEWRTEQGCASFPPRYGRADWPPESIFLMSEMRALAAQSLREHGPQSIRSESTRLHPTVSGTAGPIHSLNSARFVTLVGITANISLRTTF